MTKHLAPGDEEPTVVSYRYTPSLDEAVRAIESVKGFAADMRAQGIHVGLGMPGVCVTCDQPWPCSGSRDA